MAEYDPEPYVTRTLVIANCLVFGYQLSLLLQGGVDALEPFIDMYGATYDHTIAAGNYETLVTAGFLHAGVGHLLGNLIALYLFGKAAESVYGHLNTAIIYGVSLVTGSLLFMALNMDAAAPAIGASGAIFGLIGALLFGAPERSLARHVPVLHHLSVPLLRNFFSVIVIAGLFLVLPELLLTMGVIEPATDANVAHTGHIGGLLGGAVLAWLWRPRHAQHSLLFLGLYSALAGATWYITQTGPGGRIEVLSFSVGADVAATYVVAALVAMTLLLRLLTPRQPR